MAETGRDHLHLLLAFGIAAAISQPRLPAPAAEPGGFDGPQALARVESWAQQPRPAASPALADVQDQIATVLEQSGLTVQRLEAGQGLTNLLAHAPGVLPDATPDQSPSGVWLTAHSDSAPDAPGAADDGLGLAVVTGVVQALSQGTGPPPGLHVLITDGEELGLKGARAFARSVYWPVAEPVPGSSPAGGAPLIINVEARGTSGPAFMFQTAGPDPRILNGWQQSGCDAQTGSMARAVYDLLPNDTDFTVFRRHGAWGYDFALIHSPHLYHTPGDTPASLDPRSLQQTGDCVLGLARYWLDRLGRNRPQGAHPAERPAARAPGSHVYGQILGFTWVAPAWRVRTAGLLLLLALPWHTLYDSRRDVLAGIAGWLLTPALAFGIGWLALMALVRWPPFLAAPAEMPGAWPIYLAATAAGLLTGPLLLRPLLPRLPDLTRGWHAGVVLLAAAAALALPSVGYLLLPGALVSVFRLRDQPRIALLPAVLAGLWLGPLLFSLPVALTSRALPLLCVAPWILLAWLL